MAVGCSLASSKVPVHITLCSFNAELIEAYCADPIKNEVTIVPAIKLDNYIMMSPQDFGKIEAAYQEFVLRHK